MTTLLGEDSKHVRDSLISGRQESRRRESGIEPKEVKKATETVMDEMRRDEALSAGPSGECSSVKGQPSVALLKLPLKQQKR